MTPMSLIYLNIFMRKNNNDHLLFVTSKINGNVSQRNMEPIYQFISFIFTVVIINCVFDLSFSSDVFTAAPSPNGQR